MTLNPKQLIVLLEAMRAIDQYGGHAGIAGRWAQQGAGKALIKPLLADRLICAKTLEYCGIISLTHRGLERARDTFTYTYRDMPTEGKVTYQDRQGRAVLVTEGL